MDKDKYDMEMLKIQQTLANCQVVMTMVAVITVANSFISLIPEDQRREYALPIIVLQVLAIAATFVIRKL